MPKPAHCYRGPHRVRPIQFKGRIVNPRWRHRATVGVFAVALFVSSCNSADQVEPPGPETLPPATSATTMVDTTIPATTTTDAPEIAPPVTVTPADDIAALVASADPGTEFVLTGGIHRADEIRPKDGMTFRGLPDAVLSGAIELDGFTKAGEQWELTGAPLDQTGHGSCAGEYEACRYRNDLFMDDHVLWRVDEREELEAGSWWSDGTTIVVFDDPAVRNVELAVTNYAFVGSANDVTIADLVVEKYAVRAQEGAIQSQQPAGGDMGSGWLIESVEARLNHGAGIRVGSDTVVRDSFIHHNGQLGIAGSRGTNILIEDCEIAFNNTRGFSTGWEAGGTKFTRTTGLRLVGNNVHDNFGPGLWVDIDAYETQYLDNTVTDNTGPGIFHEISYDALISGNTVTGNGFAKPVWLWGGGILIAASEDVEVTNNTVAGNADGIAAIQQDRSEDSGGPYYLSNLWVHHNTITMETGQSGLVEDFDDDAVFTSRNNRFDFNTYLQADGRAFAWDGRDLTWSGWNRAGQDQNGTRE